MPWQPWQVYTSILPLAGSPLAKALDAKHVKPAIRTTVSIDRIMFLRFPAGGCAAWQSRKYSSCPASGGKRARASSAPSARMRRRVCLLHRVDGKRRMRVRTACAHLGGDPDRFHDLLLGRARFQRGPGVALDAVGTLRGVRHRHRDQLLGDARQRTVREYRAAEILER